MSGTGRLDTSHFARANYVVNAFGKFSSEACLCHRRCLSASRVVAHTAPPLIPPHALRRGSAQRAHGGVLRTPCNRVRLVSVLFVSWFLGDLPTLGPPAVCPPIRFLRQDPVSFQTANDIDGSLFA